MNPTSKICFHRIEEPPLEATLMHFPEFESIMTAFSINLWLEAPNRACRAGVFQDSPLTVPLMNRR